MSQIFNRALQQQQTFANKGFQPIINMQQSSIRDQSIHNLTFRSSSKQLYEEALQFLLRYQPINPSFPIQTLKKRSSLTLKHYKQSHYYGQIANSKKHGLGIMIYSSQKIYQGQWQNDKKHGNGSQIFTNGCYYKGKYQNGKPEGKGVYAWGNGQIYQGDWKKGLRHGTGFWKGANGDSYDGEWRQGKPNGYGILISNGNSYEGEFKDSLKNGTGIQKFANGDMYRGYYVNGVPSGQGSYYWADKSYFKGYFLNGLREGKGIWKKGSGNCDKYEGGYKNDKKWGYGQFTWENGNYYKGNYEGDVRSGYGEMYWVNGSYYKGEWVNGVQHGEGQIFIPEFGYKRAMFSNNIISEVLNQKPINGSHGSKTRQNSMEKSKSSKQRIRIKNPIKYKKANQNIIRYSIRDKIESNRQAATQQIEYPKAKNFSLKVNNSMKTPNKRRKFISSKQKSEQKINDYRFQSLDIFKNKQQQKGNKSGKQKDRILHSSFYIYKLNARLGNQPERVSSSNHRTIIQS